MSEWITATQEDYVARAVAAAQNLPALAATRAALRDHMRASPLCNAKTFTRSLEETFSALAARQL